MPGRGGGPWRHLPDAYICRPDFTAATDMPLPTPAEQPALQYSVILCEWLDAR